MRLPGKKVKEETKKKEQSIANMIALQTCYHGKVPEDENRDLKGQEKYS